LDSVFDNRSASAGTGHFHLLIDEDTMFAPGETIPFDSTHLHYGKGQTSVTVPLAPGQHKLALQFANAVHQSYGPEYLKIIEVNTEVNTEVKTE
jgi:hypothetical protein